MPLSVGIVGAGIAGLGAAIGLRRAGHHVEIFEQSRFKNEIGAAITITPNGQRVLDHWNFDPVEAQGVKAQEIRMMDASSLEAFVHDSFDTMESEFGQALWHYHRADLHSTLRRIAESPDSSPGHPAVIQCGLLVIKVDHESGLITLENGHQVKKDLIVVANGHKSHLFPAHMEKPITKKGRSVYRCLIPFDRILGEPELEKIFKDKPSGFWVPASLQTMTICVTYPCRNSEELNVALLYNTRPDQVDDEDWHSPATVEDVLSVTKDFHPLVRLLLSKSPEVKGYTLAKREPTDQYTYRKTVFIGDAAHVMPPTHAQGGVLGIEEAGALEVLLKGIEDPAQVEERLKVYDKIMRPHGVIGQQLSEGDESGRRIAEQLSRKPLPPGQTMPFTHPWRSYFYDYNVLQEAERALGELKG